MIHLGDICQINGADIEPVDVITGGSPCQDLSIAGNRKGLAGERSGLFMEQIRIIKEMREADRKRGRSGEFVRPRYCVWENVTGAMSSNKGCDFQAVLTEFVRVAEPDAPDVPMPEKRKWPKSGCVYDDMGGWSVAWRVHDAQFWGVPQRRKRIALVADFNGLTASTILFDPQYRRETEGAESDETESGAGDGSRPEVQIECEGLSGHYEPSGTPWEGTAEGVEGSIGDASGGRTVAGGTAISFQERAGKPGGGRESLSKVSGQEPCQRQIDKAYSIQGNVIDRDAKQNGDGVSEDVSPTVNGVDRHGVLSVDCRNGYETEELNGTLQAKPNGGYTLNGGCSESAGFDGSAGATARSVGYQKELGPTLEAGKAKCVMTKKF